MEGLCGRIVYLHVLDIEEVGILGVRSRAQRRRYLTTKDHVEAVWAAKRDIVHSAEEGSSGRSEVLSRFIGPDI
jgi:hypothetical protein